MNKVIGILLLGLIVLFCSFYSKIKKQKSIKKKKADLKKLAPEYPFMRITEKVTEGNIYLLKGKTYIYDPWMASTDEVWQRNKYSYGNIRDVSQSASKEDYDFLSVGDEITLLPKRLLTEQSKTR